MRASGEVKQIWLGLLSGGQIVAGAFVDVAYVKDYFRNLGVTKNGGIFPKGFCLGGICPGGISPVGMCHMG